MCQIVCTTQELGNPSDSGVDFQSLAWSHRAGVREVRSICTLDRACKDRVVSTVLTCCIAAMPVSAALDEDPKSSGIMQIEAETLAKELGV